MEWMEGQSDSSFENSIESGIGMDGWMDAVADGSMGDATR